MRHKEPRCLLILGLPQPAVAGNQEPLTQTPDSNVAQTKAQQIL